MNILSIVTINYNNLEVLKRTVESVQCQSFRDFEWIVIDGASDDGSREYLDSISSIFSYYISEPDSGIYQAINKGICQSHGEYLLFLNSGDTLYNCETLAKVFVNPPAGDVLYGDMIQVTNSNHRWIKYLDDLSLRFFLYDSLCHQATFFKRYLFENNLYDESFRIVSDWAMNIKLLCEGKVFTHLPYPVVYYDNNGISAKKENNELLISERTDAFEKYMPTQLKADVKWYYENYYFTRKRRSLRTIMDGAIWVCQKIDAVLNQWEQIKRNGK